MNRASSRSHSVFTCVIESTVSFLPLYVSMLIVQKMVLVECNICIAHLENYICVLKD